MIMYWTVTSKPYSICCENEKTRSNLKSDFRNKLQLMPPLKPINISPTDIKVCVVDTMRVLRLIPITTIQPPTFMKWKEAVKIYLENLPGNTLHVVPGDGNILKKKSSRKYDIT